METIKRLKVLIVEDDEVTFMMLEDILASAFIVKFEVQHAKTLAEGMKIIGQGEVEAVLFDLNLPDSDTKNTISRISEISKQIPVLILTRTDDVELAIEAVNMGVQDYVVKDQVEGPMLRRSIIYAIERHQLMQELVEEKKRSEALLLNILPVTVAKELISNGKARTRYYNFATVLFTDFTDFTRIASKVDPEILVKELDFCFAKFDDIAKHYGIEKIKTIGDAYMCAGGIPEPNETHAVNILRAAFEFRDFIKERKQSIEQKGEIYWDVRIGVHGGPLIAGVVGKMKFAYDIWGDTVNTASRIESASEPGKINISRALYEKVKNHFSCTYRGKIGAKGKGELDMYFVEEKNETEKHNTTEQTVQDNQEKRSS